MDIESGHEYLENAVHGYDIIVGSLHQKTIWWTGNSSLIMIKTLHRELIPLDDIVIHLDYTWYFLDYNWKCLIVGHVFVILDTNR